MKGRGRKRKKKGKKRRKNGKRRDEISDEIFDFFEINLSALPDRKKVIVKTMIVKEKEKKFRRPRDSYFTKEKVTEPVQ